MPGKERWTVYSLLKDKGATEEELRKRPSVPRSVFEQIHTSSMGCKVTRKNLRYEPSGWFDSDALQLPDLVFNWSAKRTRYQAPKIENFITVNFPLDNLQPRLVYITSNP